MPEALPQSPATIKHQPASGDHSPGPRSYGSRKRESPMTHLRCARSRRRRSTACQRFGTSDPGAMGRGRGARERPRQPSARTAIEARNLRTVQVVEGWTTVMPVLQVRSSESRLRCGPPTRSGGPAAFTNDALLPLRPAGAHGAAVPGPGPARPARRGHPGPRTARAEPETPRANRVGPGAHARLGSRIESN